MEVRGSVISNIKAYVETKHADQFDEWYSALSEASRELMERPVTSKWYPLHEGILEPTEKMCELFYSSPRDGAWQSGRFSAQEALTGIYKVFVVVSTPLFLIKRASRIMGTFYSPTEVSVVDNDHKSMLVHFTKLPTRSKLLEYRIAGWMEKALEICGCKNLSVKIPKSIADGDDVFEVDISWS